MASVASELTVISASTAGTSGTKNTTAASSPSQSVTTSPTQDKVTQGVAIATLPSSNVGEVPVGDPNVRDSGRTCVLKVPPRLVHSESSNTYRKPSVAEQGAEEELAAAT